MSEGDALLPAPKEAFQADQPVSRPRGHDETPSEGLALCLSGGGYRAMLFHLGVLWRLNDAGCLPRLDRVSSVSGGSITAGVLGLHWCSWTSTTPGVGATFVDARRDPIRGLAGHTSTCRPCTAGCSPSGRYRRLVATYREHLFGEAMPPCRPLPPDARFVINATNLESGALMRFSRRYVADWRVGRVAEPDRRWPWRSLLLGVPAGALTVRLELGDADWKTDEGNDLTAADYRDELALTDGGVYDNLGLETAWKRCRTVLVADGGGQMQPTPTRPQTGPGTCSGC